MIVNNAPLFSGGVSVTCNVTVLENPGWGTGKKMGRDKEEGCLPEEVLGKTRGCYIRLQTVT